MTLENAFSPERLARYKVWAAGDAALALELYALNVAVSEAFYTSLHVFEITLRNAIHNAITAHYGSDWFTHAAIPLNPIQQVKVEQARNRFSGHVSDGRIVAELTFGFWTGMFGKDKYMLWGKCFQPMFDAGYPVKRKQIAVRLNRIRKLRNRIAHHEPIIQQDLQGIYTETRELIGWLSTDALIWCDTYCRFNAICPKQQIIIGNLKNPALSLR